MLSQAVARWTSLASLFVTLSSAHRETPWTGYRSETFHENLEALGLLGSHFGSVDVPATYDYIVVGGGRFPKLLSIRQPQLTLVAQALQA